MNICMYVNIRLCFEPAFMDGAKSLINTVFIYAIILLPSDRDFVVLKKYKYVRVYIHKKIIAVININSNQV